MDIIAAGPPTSPWNLPSEAAAEVTQWLSMTAYVALAFSIVSTFIFGAFLALDKERGEPVSARAPYVRGLQISLGVVSISAASSLAAMFI